MSTQKDATRVRLLEAARRLLIGGGFHQVKLEDIAEAAGVSRQAVYKSHFTSKSELMLELVRYVHVAENLDQLTAPYFAARSGVDQLRELVRAIVLIEGRIHDVALALHAAALSDADARAALQDRLALRRRVVSATIERVQADGQLSSHWPPEEAVDMLLALLSADSYEQLVRQRGWAPERLIERIWVLSGSFLREPPHAEPRSRKS